MLPALRGRDPRENAHWLGPLPSVDDRIS